MKLYEASEALGITDEWLEELGGELTPEMEALLNQAEGDFNTKVENVALKIKALEAEAEAIKTEEARLAARRKARENGARNLKAYLERCLVAAGKEKVNGLLVTVAMQLNPPSVQIADDVDPQELYGAGCPVVVREPETYRINKDLVKLLFQSRPDALPNGVTVTRSSSLRIR